MSATIIELPHQTALRTPIGHAIRTGESSYRQLEHLYAEGRLPSATVIIDASKARHQREFIRSLRDNASDIILDTKVAELSEIGKFRGSAKGTAELFQVPDVHRVRHFRHVEMRNAERKAGDLARLNTGDDKLNKALADGRKRIDSMARMYETLAERDRPAARPMQRRNALGTASGQGAL